MIARVRTQVDARVVVSVSHCVSVSMALFLHARSGVVFLQLSSVHDRQ